MDLIRKRSREAAGADVGVGGRRGWTEAVLADERLPTAAILEVMREVEKVLIRYGGTSVSGS